MAYSVGRRPLTAEAWVRSWTGSWCTKWHWESFFPENSDFFPCQHHSTNAYTRLHLNITLMRRINWLIACESSNKPTLFSISVSNGWKKGTVALFSLRRYKFALLWNIAASENAKNLTITWTMEISHTFKPRFHKLHFNIIISLNGDFQLRSWLAFRTFMI